MEDFINSSEELIEESKIGYTQMAADIENKIKIEIFKQEIKSLDSEIIPVADGYVEIQVSKDDMIVTADFYPPSGGGKPIEKEDVRNNLMKLGIVNGVDWNTIKSTIVKCNYELVQINDFVIARGDVPVDEVPPHLDIEEHLLENPEWTADEESLSLDYKQFTPYILVKKGELLAKTIPVKKGKFGKTVMGKTVPFKTSLFTQIKHRKNTKLKNNRIVTTCDGRFKYHKDHFWVNEVLEIMGDVDYKTGNICFPGDIIIHGEVADGFKVESQGSIFCKKTLDASEVICEKDLVIKYGIIGRNKGKIKVGGSIRGKHIENCYVESKDSIYINNAVFHSILHTQNKLEMGKKSVIVGGKIFALNGIIAHQIGTKMGIKTKYIVELIIQYNKSSSG